MQQITKELLKNEFYTEELNGQVDKDKPKRITLGTEMPERTPAIVIGETIVNYCGNIAGLTGQVKTGKTAISTAICKAFLTGQTHLGISVSLTGKILFIDTEQAAIDTKEKIYKNILYSVNDCKKDIEDLHCYNFRGMQAKDMISTTEDLFHKVQPTVAIIDGISDFVDSVNDEKQARELIAMFLRLTAQYNCFALLVLHDNHNTEKSRGHLGSELDRKAESVFITSKDVEQNTFVLKTKFCRNAGNPEKITFYFDTDLKRFELADENTFSERKFQPSKKLQEQADSVLLKIFEKDDQLLYSEIVGKIVSIEREYLKKELSESAAKTRVRKFVQAGFIEHQGQYYRLSDELNALKENDKRQLKIG